MRTLPTSMTLNKLFYSTTSRAKFFVFIYIIYIYIYIYIYLYIMVVIGLEVNYLSNYYIKIVWMIFFSVFYKKKKKTLC